MDSRTDAGFEELGVTFSNERIEREIKWSVHATTATTWVISFIAWGVCERKGGWGGWGWALRALASRIDS